MFAGGQHVSITDATDYDFEKAENAAKWKGVFITSLRKVSSYGCSSAILPTQAIYINM